VRERKKERKKERKNEVNVPSSEVALTSRRAHFLLIASIPMISRERASSVAAAAFTSSSSLPPPPPPP